MEQSDKSKGLAPGPVAGFITALQSAVLATENDLGTAAARNYVRKDGAVTITARSQPV